MSRLTLAHPILPLSLAMALMASGAGCYAFHGLDGEPTPVPTVDASVSVADAPVEPDVVCLDCSCCSCGRPSTGAICPLIGLDECCAPTAVVSEAWISSATLGDECPMEDGGDCDGFGCGCAQTAVQIGLRSAAPPGLREAVTIDSVRVLRDGAVVADLSPRSFLIWSAAASAYLPWDSTISGGEELTVRVETSAPDWVAVGGGDAWRTYGVPFRVEVTLSIGGATLVVFLEPVMRQAEIDT